MKGFFVPMLQLCYNPKTPTPKGGGGQVARREDIFRILEAKGCGGEIGTPGSGGNPKRSLFRVVGIRQARDLDVHRCDVLASA